MREGRWGVQNGSVNLSMMHFYIAIFRLQCGGGPGPAGRVRRQRGLGDNQTLTRSGKSGNHIDQAKGLPVVAVYGEAPDAGEVFKFFL